MDGCAIEISDDIDGASKYRVAFSLAGASRVLALPRPARTENSDGYDLRMLMISPSNRKVNRSGGAKMLICRGRVDYNCLWFATSPQIPPQWKGAPNPIKSRKGMGKKCNHNQL